MSDRKEAKWEKLLRLMQDGRWYSFRELHDVAGWRFGARLDDLKQKGWEHEHRARGEKGELEYRLFRRAPVGMQLGLKLDLNLTDTTLEALR